MDRQRQAARSARPTQTHSVDDAPYHNGRKERHLHGHAREEIRGRAVAPRLPFADEDEAVSEEPRNGREAEQREAAHHEQDDIRSRPDRRRDLPFVQEDETDERTNRDPDTDANPEHRGIPCRDQQKTARQYRNLSTAPTAAAAGGCCLQRGGPG